MGIEMDRRKGRKIAYRKKMGGRREKEGRGREKKRIEIDIRKERRKIVNTRRTDIRKEKRKEKEKKEKKEKG